MIPSKTSEESDRFESKAQTINLLYKLKTKWTIHSHLSLQSYTYKEKCNSYNQIQKHSHQIALSTYLFLGIIAVVTLVLYVSSSQNLQRSIWLGKISDSCGHVNTLHPTPTITKTGKIILRRLRSKINCIWNCFYKPAKIWTADSSS